MLLDKLIFYCLAWAVFWLPFVAVPAGVFCKNFTDLGLELALLLWLGKVLFYRKTGFRKIGWNIDNAFLGIAAASLLSIPFSFIKVWAIGDFLGLLTGIFAVYLIVSVTRTKKELYILYSAILSSAIVVAILGFFQLPLKHSDILAANPLFKPLLFLTTSSSPSRVCSTFIEYTGVNVYSGYLIIIFILLFTPFLFLHRKLSNTWKLAGTISALILLFNLVLTKGRAAYIALFATLLYVFWQNKHLQKALLFGLSLLTIGSILFVPLVRDTVLDIFNSKSTSNQERAQIYLPALRQIAERPLFGFGDGHAGRKIIRDQRNGRWEAFDVNEYFDPRFKKITTYDEKQAYYAAHGIRVINRPHNIYLTTAIDTGLFGLCAFLYLFYVLLLATITLYKKYPDKPEGVIALALSGAFLSIVAYGFLHDSLNARPYAMLFWILIGLTGTTLKLVSTSKSGKRQVASGKFWKKKQR
jgi:O-antigen ligase